MVIDLFEKNVMCQIVFDEELSDSSEEDDINLVDDDEDEEDDGSWDESLLDDWIER